ncbi:NFACT family protein [Vagococcus sp. PNs007]|uniref:Rqc2 homolog RqcH n=1 Tax=Vagococcus proximus TaxID=2991417 RepID=A0ABT5WZA1_9ENTE|nr:NFACT RNA binding domain-containing protein [Vagococcus proximus]MDF0479084.1 NFACT family protein [Vagococcus proximus]
MAFDGVFTHAMINELSGTLMNGRLSKIHQPFDNELILVIRNQGKNHKLLLSAHSAYARIQLTTVDYQNPSTPPNFCMMLRKYLEGAILQKMKQIENDRIVHFEFSKRNELGDLENVVLVVELMGRHSNIILVNKESNKILDCIKHVGPSQNSYRILLPGAEYVRPPKNVEQRDPFTTDYTLIFELLATAEELTPHYFQQTFQGLGQDTARELAYQMAENPTALLATWKDFWSKIVSNPVPTLTIFENKEYFTPITYDYLGPEKYTFDSLSALLEMFYEGKAEKERVKQQAGALVKKIAGESKKIKAKQKKFKQALLDTENAEVFRQKGELLTTFLHEVPRGAKVVTVDNYYEENTPITISLREDLSPSQNAQKYFQKYGKLKNSVKIIEEQLEIAEQEVNYLDSVLSQLELATPSEVDYIKEELISEKYIRPTKQQKAKKNQKSKPEKYMATDGTIILVGKNNLQNDQLTLKTADKNHFWLHAKDIPGSHVIVQSAHPSEDTLIEAANLAAYYSKFRLSSSVPVDYVQVKHIKKPNGSKPGYVIYENQKTLFVTPDKEKVHSLKK